MPNNLELQQKLTPKDQPPPPKKGVVWNILGYATALLLLICVFLPLLGVIGLFAPGPLVQKSTLIIPRGANAGDIATLLKHEHAIYAASLFRLAAKLVAGNGLKAGEYDIQAASTPLDIAQMIHEGHSVVRLFTVAEGLTSTEIIEALNDETTLSGKIDMIPTEGSLLPETYRYSLGDTRAGLISRMQKAMQEKINELWAARDASTPFTSPREAVTLASIVERETSLPNERPRIAGVFYNRLKLHMRLQSDPTVIYALTHGRSDLGRSLSHEDLVTPSPINTYTNEGLPPQPICNPGSASLQAVLHPESHNFLYFVADGKGGHAFASTLEAHNENINRWHAFMKSSK